MVVKSGHVVAAYGDITRQFQAHSIRKSLLSAMYGTAVSAGEVNLDATLEQLGIDDDSVLTAEEKKATLRQLISARSGVYLPAAYAGAEQNDRPARGAFPPGTHWFYNNWDFNVAGVAYEQLTRDSWYESFRRRIAAPVGMEDFTPSDGFAVYDPLLSRHPAHTLRISARDLARFGQLYLQRGQWNGRQIIPAAWIDESFRLHWRLEDGSGYGYMWWIHPAGTLNPQEYPALATRDVYLARGTGGQVLHIVPSDDLVVVHRGDTDNGPGVPGGPIWRMLELVVRANVGKPVSRPVLVDVEPIELASQRPPSNSAYSEVTRDLVHEMVGTYRDGPILTRIFVWRGRPFITMPRQGSAELFALPDGTLTLRAQPGIRFQFERDSTGKISRIRTSVNGREFTASRVQ
jgi:CubicO group peptidase (beta-lactamase class C family)